MAKCDYKEIEWSRVREVHGDTFVLDDGTTYRCRVRKLTPRECFRLMDVDEDNIDKIEAAGISKTQQYKMAGNSIVVSCMVEIFRNLFLPTKREPKRGEQLKLFV